MLRKKMFAERHYTGKEKLPRCYAASTLVLLVIVHPFRQIKKHISHPPGCEAHWCGLF